MVGCGVDVGVVVIAVVAYLVLEVEHGFCFLCCALRDYFWEAHCS